MQLLISLAWMAAHSDKWLALQAFVEQLEVAFRICIDVYIMEFICKLTLLSMVRHAVMPVWIN